MVEPLCLILLGSYESDVGDETGSNIGKGGWNEKLMLGQTMEIGDGSNGGQGGD